LVKDIRGNLLARSHNNSSSWKNYFCHLLNVNIVNNIRQTEMCTAEPLVPEPCYFEDEIAIGMLK